MSAPLPRFLRAKYSEIYNERAPKDHPGPVRSGPTSLNQHRRSAAPFRRFRWWMGGRWHVALARFCWISCMAGGVVRPAAAAATQGRALSACRFEVAAPRTVLGITDDADFPPTT